MCVQLSDDSDVGLSFSAKLWTCVPTRKAISTTSTATGTSEESDGVEATAVAANRPEQRPTLYVCVFVMSS